VLGRQTPARYHERPRDGVVHHLVGDGDLGASQIGHGRVSSVGDAVHGDCCRDCKNDDTDTAGPDRSASATACMPPVVPRRS